MPVSKYPIGLIRKGCAANEHNFVIANDDSLKCEGCGVKCSGENLAALGFVHRSNIKIDVDVAKAQPAGGFEFDGGLEFLREPQADGYLVSVSRRGVGRYDIKMTIPDADPETCAPRQIRIEDSKPTEAPCRTCNKPNDLGVKVCWCCGNAP